MIKFDLKPYSFRGVVHVGAGKGAWVKTYEQLGVSNILWIEKENNLYRELYDATKFVNIRQQYWFENLGLSENKAKPFKKFFRENIVDIDLDLYDLVHISCGNKQDILAGFEDLIQQFRGVLLTNAAYYDRVDYYLHRENFATELYADDQMLFLNKNGV